MTGWDGWMAWLTWWTWVWASFRSWWWPGEPGVLLFMGLQRVGHDWVNWTELIFKGLFFIVFSIMLVPIYIPTNSVGGFLSLYTVSSICCLWIFWWWPFYFLKKLFIFGYPGSSLLCMDFSLIVVSRAYSLVAVSKLLGAVVSLVVEHQL